MSNRSLDEHLRLRKQWQTDGTFRRLDDAVERKTPVKIRRTSGEMIDGLVVSCSGHGGLTCVVAWGPGSDQAVVEVGADRIRFPFPVPNKTVDTADVIDWNPWLRGDA